MKNPVYSQEVRLSEKRLDIQIIRGISVSFVFLFHLNTGFMPNGYLGVDFFFVISGFVLAPSISNLLFPVSSIWQNLKIFLVNRFWRLAPALLFSLFIIAILILLLGPIYDHKIFARQGLSALLQIANFGAYRYSGDYFSPNPNPLLHTWSLSAEVQMYLVIPILIICVRLILKNRLKPHIIVNSFLACVSFIFFINPYILSNIYTKIGFPIASQISYYSPVSRTWQFCIGALVYYISNSECFRNRKFGKTQTLLLTIIIGVFFITSFDFGQLLGAITATILCSVSLLFRNSLYFPAFFSRLLVWIGDRSYSIYLVHMPLIYLCSYSFLFSNMNSFFKISISLIATLIFGAVLYSKVELKFRNSLKDLPSKAQTIKRRIIIILLFLSSAFIFIFMNLGVDNKYFGFDRNIDLQPYAGYLDPKCERDIAVGPICIYSTPGAKRMLLLIGDSHAGHISQVVLDAAKENGWNVAIRTSGACHIVFTFKENNFQNDSCLQRNLDLLDWTKKNSPDLIIVSQFLQKKTDFKPHEEGILAFKKFSKKVLVVENTPVFPSGISNPRPLIMGPSSPTKIFRDSEMISVSDKNSEKLRTWANSHSIDSLNLNSLFCQNGICKRWDNGHWLYRDADHLSVYGASLAKPIFEKYLETLD